jgi:hypothetical protein
LGEIMFGTTQEPLPRFGAFPAGFSDTGWDTGSCDVPSVDAGSVAESGGDEVITDEGANGVRSDVAKSVQHGQTMDKLTFSSDSFTE